MMNKRTIKRGIIILVITMIIIIILKKGIVILGYIFYLIFVLSGGFKGKEVTITKDYVINPNWSEADNCLTVSRMMLKDSCQTISLRSPSENELLNWLIEDTSFEFIACVKYNGEDYDERKVYFNKDNGFLWRRLDGSDPRKILGEFQQNTWYILSGLSMNMGWCYVYLDTSDSLHVYKVWNMRNI
jgi:hypothetical protein